jgi:hypothetical protein
MNIDSHELQNVALTDAAAPPRVDLYAGIHKAARALMCDTLTALGRVDSADAQDLAEVTQRVMALLDFCRAHLQHENDFVHVALEARALGASDLIANEHEAHVQDIARLRCMVLQVREADASRRAALVHALYQQLALFVAHNFEHMHIEETAHNAVLWARYTDAELMEIHAALVASIPPDEMMVIVRWLVPFMNPAERADMLGDMQAHAPAPVFEAVMAEVRPHLTDREWGKLAAVLRLPVVRWQGV